MTIKILIIEDHPAMIEGYKSILSFFGDDYNFEYTVAADCEAAYKHIFNSHKNFDLIFLDLMIPPAESLKLYSGEDLGTIIKKQMPNAKLIILTSHVEAIILYSIVKQINPEGLLVKSDFSGNDLILAIKNILAGNTHYTINVTRSIVEMNRDESFLDKYNREILKLICQGIKTKNLPKHLNLSLSSIDKRKVQIKDFLGIIKGNDEDIVLAAKKQGLV
ncbi:MAG: response regulator transcription factor [Flavobacterium sp.]|uniref:response regulator n=1 Tax=Flavobacterium sp. TaxID=239 RepID=UPI001207AD25|nr:response regulator transcription factor [Flavobacterium sp.]RZJ68024.1 MAG: response regulator transcription factor [Flavobacterium sp.]